MSSNSRHLKSPRLKGSLLLAALMVVALSLAGCYTRTGATRLEIFTEMHYSQAFRSQEPNRLLPPEGAVPVTGKGITYTAAEAKNLANPMPRTPQVLERGTELFRVNCSMCHGVQGKGDGPAGEFLVKWKYGRPTDLTAAGTQGRTDGDLFSIVTFTIFGRPGISPMPEFGKLLTDEARWSLVHYMRFLQGR